MNTNTCMCTHTAYVKRLFEDWNITATHCHMSTRGSCKNSHLGQWTKSPWIQWTLSEKRQWDSEDFFICFSVHKKHSSQSMKKLEHSVLHWVLLEVHAYFPSPLISEGIKHVSEDSCGKMRICFRIILFSAHSEKNSVEAGAAPLQRGDAGAWGAAL